VRFAVTEMASLLEQALDAQVRVGQDAVELVPLDVQAEPLVPVVRRPGRLLLRQRTRVPIKWTTLQPPLAQAQ